MISMPVPTCPHPLAHGTATAPGTAAAMRRATTFAQPQVDRTMTWFRMPMRPSGRR